MIQAIEHLLNSKYASIKLRCHTEILGTDKKSPILLELQKEIEQSDSVVAILKKMHPDGYWLQKNRRTGKITGNGVEYGSYSTTHFALSYLSELGLTKSHPLVQKSANRYLNLMAEDGDWWNHMSCLYAYNIRTFVHLGYRTDARLQKTIDLLLQTKRYDGGYLCDMHENKRKTKPVKSCYRGAVKALLAFSELPEYWNHPRCLELLNYFFTRKIIYKSNSADYVNKDVRNTSFPITWGANTFEVLLALSKMGFGNDPRLAEAWNLLENHKLENGLYKLDSTPSQCLFKVGRRGEENDWITFYILLAKKHRDKDKKKG
jgi:hypothetical protein